MTIAPSQYHPIERNEPTSIVLAGCTDRLSFINVPCYLIDRLLLIDYPIRDSFKI